jgi:hypothetical protein
MQMPVHLLKFAESFVVAGPCRHLTLCCITLYSQRLPCPATLCPAPPCLVLWSGVMLVRSQHACCACAQAGELPYLTCAAVWL